MVVGALVEGWEGDGFFVVMSAEGGVQGEDVTTGGGF